MTEGTQKIFVQVAVALPVSGTFTYTVGNDLAEKATVGKRSLVSFKGRTVTGYILRIVRPEKRRGLKDILTVLDPYPLFPANMVTFFEWLATYYRYPIGLVIKTALPTGLNVNIPEGKEIPPMGWLDKVGVSKRVFVTLRKGATIDKSLRDHNTAPRNESEFLEMVIQREEVSFAEIKKTFGNGTYLVDKWVKKGLLKKSLVPVVRDIAGETVFIPPSPARLNSKQKEAADRIKEKLGKGFFFTYLLHGITGSGKTEVYYHAVRDTMELGRQCIIMVPEIALTVSLAALFKARLGDRVAILHSALSLGERYDQWIRIVRGDADVVIGARSALFAPLARLGLIIIDEEHDTSYKQEEKFRYQARDAATMRAKLVDALVILGSGTPSVQSYQNAVSGKYGLLTMPERVFKRALPPVTIVDMAHFDSKSITDIIISPPLREALRENLDREKQAILFLNRRGFSTVYLCRSCGEAIRCPNCELSLTYHKDKNNLVCHYCGFTIQPPQRCPSCTKEALKPYGFGTERVVEAVTEIFPAASVERMDRDTIRHKGSLQQVLRRLLHHEIDILVGTQMVTKGHDFPNITLVGVISADLSLNTPDFRAGEMTFQLLSQVAGRTGRGAAPGKVIIQTFNPAHYAVDAARNHDYVSFFTREISLRRQLNYPPFSSLANLRLLGNNRVKTEIAATQIGRKIKAMAKEGFKGRGSIEVLGPVEAPLAKLKGKYRHQILIKSRSSRALTQLLKDIEKAGTSLLSTSGVRLIIDVDPYQMM
jgi:primosomal protein N' (replication factor Y)